MSMDRMREFVSEMIKPLRNRVYTMITRAVLETVKDDKGMQLVKLKLLADETRDDVEHFQSFGITSNAPEGSECLAFSVGGNREHLVAVAIGDRKTRFKNLASGETAIYTDDGTVIHLKKGGIIKVLAATKLDVDAPLLELGTGILEKVLNGETFQTKYNAHTHPFTGNLGITAVTLTPTTPSIPTDLSTQVKASK